LTVTQILPRVFLPLFQVAAFALHLMVCLSSPGARKVLALPGKPLILLLNFQGIPLQLLL
jgi:hypothetical protein